MYKFSLLVNTILSVAFIGVVIYGLLQKATPEAGTLFVIFYIITVYTSFLWFNYICFKTKQLNESYEMITAAKTGKTLSVVVIILALINIVFALLATLPFVFGETEAERHNLIGLFIFVSLSIAAGVTATINARLYRKALKQNKTIVNSVINAIGDNTAP